MASSGKRIALVLALALACPALLQAQRSQQNFASFEAPRALAFAPPLSLNVPSRALMPSPFAGTADSSASPAAEQSLESQAKPGEPSLNRDQDFSFISIPIHIQVTKTPFASESRVPVAHLLGERVQLDFSFTTIRNGNLILGPILSSETLHPPPQTRSADLYGIGFSIPLGHGAQPDASKSLWRSFTRFAHDEISP